MFVKAMVMALLLGAALGFGPLSTSATGEVYVSNLGEASSGGLPFNNGGTQDLWFAQAFDTGTSSGGYSLDSIELSLGVTGSPVGSVVVYLYGSAGAAPGAQEEIVNSGTPSASGTYAFTASGIMLSPSTRYWIVAMATAPADVNPYSWNVSSTSNYSSSDSWDIYQVTQWTSSDGSTWITSFLVAPPLQFAVSATAVPEPGVLSLAGIGLTIAFFLRRK